MEKKTRGQIKFWGLTLLRLAVFVFIIIGLASVNSGGQTAPTADDWIKGNPGAKVYLIEYSDLQCPACRAYWPLIKQVESEFANDIKIIYRHFPLTTIHKNAQLAAQAAEAAGLQGKFWEMHDLLFEKQLDWSNLSNVSEKFTEYAGQLGLNVEKFKNDLNSDTVKDEVREDVATGNKAQVRGTPSFYLQGKKITNPQSYDELRQLILKQIGQ